MQKQVIDLIVFLVSLFYLLISWATIMAGNITTGGLLGLGATLALVGVITSLRKVKPTPTYLMLGGVALMAVIQLIMGSILFATILGVITFIIFYTRKASRK